MSFCQEILIQKGGGGGVGGGGGRSNPRARILIPNKLAKKRKEGETASDT